MRRLALAATALLALAACSSEEPDAGAAPPEPAAVETDLPPCPDQEGAAAAAGTIDLAFDCLGGGTLDLALAPGVPTVLNLWASWCGPCREELPLFQQLSESAGEQLRVLGVDSQDGRPQGVSFAADAGLTFPSAFDGEGELAAELGLRGLPQSVFLAADGSIAHIEAGEISSYDELRGLVAEHLGVQL
ncbi:TlpA family protein disulfide reductase [Blastococcus sp. TBT05-19]|uniref:TlpA family protein disulfide reductase n=1 Tax=Blastococcus sp. TBT05-19 TaxID=2250581 RepID=UPI000DEB9266|nr:TlpA disulfide reductase family protein [Blastococcus sp. TBT05-19]RBY94038.1 TlpA family protein disulfide reductase [Blastococcus sp. TBT05-19]